MIYTDDPIKDAETYYSNLEQRLNRRPRCSICGERIQDEYAIRLDSDGLIHEDCFTNEFRVRVEDYIEDCEKDEFEYED